MTEASSWPINELDLSWRTRNTLARARWPIGAPPAGPIVINTVADLMACSESELRSIPGFGSQSLNAVKRELGAAGLELRPSRKADRRRTDRDKTILELRAEGWTLARIGQQFGIGRERVRQILKRLAADA